MRAHSWIRWYTAGFMDDLSGFNPKRRLCPDGACTGIIGLDGRCGECGRAPGVGATESSGTDVFAVLDASEANDEFADAVDVSGVSPEPSSFDIDAAFVTGSGFDPSRRLCEDGTCVGIIGPLGTCTVCGRAPG